MRTFPYPGSKQRYAEWIIRYLPEHACYVEPFGGAAGVLVNKEPSQIEVYNDIDGDIVHFFGVLREHPRELKGWLERVPYARELYEKWATEYYEGHRPENDIERAGRWFWLRYAQFGGKYENKNGFATKAKSGSISKSLHSITHQLEKLSSRLRQTTIENLDYTGILDRYDRETTVFYCDPPYQGSEERYNSEGFNHMEFRDRISDIDGYAIVSYDHRVEWDGWHVESKDSNYKIDNTESNGGKKMVEYLAMNFNPDQTPLFSPPKQSTLPKTA